jgi:anti-sigma regulatory factor (Ser/Thr protein kinase)
MEITSTSRIAMTDKSCVGEARRRVENLAKNLDFTSSQMSHASILISEMATNLIKHATKNPQLILQTILIKSTHRLQFLALDQGPGMPNLNLCFRDGYSTVGTQGTGLGAIKRQASFSQFFSLPDIGTTVLAYIDNKEAKSSLTDLEIGGICLPLASEIISGDAWASVEMGYRKLIFVGDGLGHGPLAANASQLAVSIFKQKAHLSPAAIINVINLELKKTRGASVAVAEIDTREKKVCYAGLGNIGGTISIGKSMYHMICHDGTAGMGPCHIQEYTYPWQKNASLIMYSDGLVSRWVRHNYTGLMTRHPAVIAGTLYRDFTRGNDDITVVIARERSEFD